MAKDDIVGFEIESGVSVFDQKPFVNIKMKRVDGRTQSMQVRPNKARELGVMFFEGAVEAERDASTLAGLVEIGMGNKEDAMRFLQLIRDHREQWEDLE